MTEKARDRWGVAIDGDGFLQGWKSGKLFARQTVVFGRNGSGKSTLARHFAESDLNLVGVSGPCPEMVVFNKQYVDANVGAVFDGEGLTKALFVVGDQHVAAAEDLKRIKREETEKLEELNRHEEALESAKQKSTNLGNDLREKYRSLSRDVQNVQTKTAVDAVRAADPKVLDGDTEPDGADVADRQLLSTAENQIPLDVPGVERADVEFATDELFELLERSIPSEDDLADLEPEEQDWVRRGAELHVDRDACLLCTNHISSQRKAQLSTMLEAEAAKFVDRLDEELKRTIDFERSLTRVGDQLSGHSATLAGFQVSYASIEHELTTLKHWVRQLQTTIKTKRAHPDKKADTAALAIPEVQVSQLPRRVNDINGKLHKRRQNLGDEQAKAKARCVARIKNELLDKYEKATTKYRELEAQTEALKGELQLIEQQRAEFEQRQMKEDDARTLAAQLNHDLQRYLGHQELAVGVETHEDQVGLALYRKGESRAKGLSEGERTAVSLLHFLTQLHDKDHKDRRDELCVVLDDPVSSLDHLSARNAFAFIHEALKGSDGAGSRQRKKIGRYIILTHDDAFFSMWRDQLIGDKGKPQEGAAMLYMSAQIDLATGERKPSLKELPLSVLMYRSEYYRLFFTVCDAVVTAQSDEQVFVDVALANNTRRLLESFLGWKFPGRPNFGDSIRDAGIHVEYPNERITAIKSFLNTGSHRREPIVNEPDSHLSNYVDDVVDCLALMRKADKNHFDGMLKLIPTVQNEGKDPKSIANLTELMNRRDQINTDEVTTETKASAPSERCSGVRS